MTTPAHSDQAPVDEAMRERVAASIYNTFTAMPGVTYGQLSTLAEAADKASLNVQDIVNGKR